ncbi:MAG: hypothetical protein ABR576_09920 [Thermoanaerobaculia bacterium]
MRGARGAAVLAGLLVSLVVGVDLVRAIRPSLLVDPDPSWALPRLLLGWALTAATAAAGGLAAALFLLWGRGARARAAPEPMALRRGALAALTGAAILFGVLARFAWLDRIPVPLWVDDVSLVTPALTLEGSWRDFRDSIRPAPSGVPDPYGTVGVLYLEAHRLLLRFTGATVAGVRLPAALAGAASLVTGALLGRTLLPRGGGALVALILAGMRWHLILSRWGWVAMALVPIVDLASLLALRCRRHLPGAGGRALAPAAGAGAVMGLGAHVYLAAWVAAAGLLALILWPRPPAPRAARPGRRSLLAGVLFVAGFAATAAPLFLFREGRTAPYFVRTRDHNVLLEMRRTGSLLPPLAAAADSLVAPWLLPDPIPLNDLPGRSRLGWILGIPVAAAMARALLAPREDLSAFLLAHGGAAFAASVAGGQATLPNGFRYAYLTTVAAVAAAAGILWLVGLVRGVSRRQAALAAVGLLAISFAAGARDALFRWGESRTTFDYFHGPDTLIARAALRWERYGRTEADPRLLHSTITYGAVRRHALDPDGPTRYGLGRAAPRSGRVFSIVSPAAQVGAPSRVVERVRDAWGREWAVVVAKPQLPRK